MGKTQIFYFTKLEDLFLWTTGLTTMADHLYKNFIFKCFDAISPTYAACMVF